MPAPTNVQMKDLKIPQGPAFLSDGFIQSLEWTDDLRNDWATVLIYAPARWGKTLLIQTADNPIIAATEMGKTMGLQTISHKHIPARKITNADEFLSFCKELKRADCTMPDGYRFNTTIVDSGSHLGQQWLDAGVKALGWTDLISGAGKDTRQAYQYLAEKGRQSMKALFDVPAHICFICREGVQEETLEDGKTKIQFLAPELPGQKLPRELPGWPDATLHGVIKNGKRLIQTRTYNRAVAGIRVRGDVEVPEFIKPDLGKICRLVVSKDVGEIKRLIDELKA